MKLETQERQGFQIACPEEIAYRLGYVGAEQLVRLAEPLKQTEYGQYLLQVLQESGPRDWAGVAAEDPPFPKATG